MGRHRVFGVVAGVLVLSLALRAAPPDDPVLVIHGAPYATGEITLGVSAAEGYAGAPVWLVLGFNPLPLLSPVNTGKGPFWVGTITHVKPFGVMPAAGPLQVSASVPDVVPGAEGLHVAIQMLLPGRLTNAATVPLDAPYFLPAESTLIVSTQLSQAALFGDRHVVGDFDGDGTPDLAIGAWFEAGAFDKEGRVHVRWGPDFSEATILGSPQPGAERHFGLGLLAVDLDDDGADELVVSEGSGYPHEPDAPGRLWIYSGTIAGEGDDAFGSAAPSSLDSSGTGSAAGVYGRSTAAGDFNGDGALDLVAHVLGAEVGGLEKAGRVDVHWGPDFTVTSELVSPDPSEFSFFGERLAVADLNGDGIDDLVESSSRDNFGGTDNVGSVHLFIGPELAPFKTIQNPLPMGFNSRFGNALAAVDMNGDGLDEVLSTDQHGRGYVFWSPDYESYHLLHEPPHPAGTHLSFGYFMDVGDVNGDGHADVCIGDPFAEGTGLAYVYLGPHLSSALVVREAEPALQSEFGWFLSLSDVDADGLPEFIAGSNTGSVGGILGAGRLTVMDLGIE